MPVCLVIQSQVVSGAVGLGASAPVLWGAGVEVWPLPTVTLSGHAAMPGVSGRRQGAADIAALHRGLAAGGQLSRIDAVLSGYLPDAGVAGAVADLVTDIRAARPDMVYLCDPVLGDKGRFYLPEDLVPVFRARLLPLARIATPNMDELGWLSCGAGAGAAQLGPEVVHVTSVESSGGLGIETHAGGSPALATGPKVPHHVHGAGDAVAALLLAAHLSGRAPQDAAAEVVHRIAALVEAARIAGRDTLEPRDLVACGAALVKA
ncbi:bifunctional hydroxymethylpyrimidine kinase/phosphomethylpyrimidine kinase [Oceanibium sediminis]|uniref:bifunctional hydroxymethylpyrimidine kinase/phosphomethylpyrimidine kinase n=1 Tax=Oceanibium sediminis TaxID=2026339 RepID=UPI000DD3B044|nr:bifunctional hydroxymethylpyrimidine kinase/phosphomethylpyrimidine kinase [Oceanibium sediminis]